MANDKYDSVAPGAGSPKGSSLNARIEQADKTSYEYVTVQLDFSVYSNSNAYAHCLKSNSEPVHFDPVLEKRLRLKIDLCIVPTVAILYLFCFIDRANLGMKHSAHRFSSQIRQPRKY